MTSLDWDEARRIAASYPECARYTPYSDRNRYLTKMQRFAWALRFEPETADPEMFFWRPADVASAQPLPIEPANAPRFVRDGIRPNAKPNT